MCPLFGGRRDISLFRGLNREIVNRWIQQECGIYKLALNETEQNLYGEADGKVYYKPVRVPVLIGRDPQSWNGDEFGQDYTSQATFAFLRDDLKRFDLYPEVGDVVVWDNEYYEFDSVINNQYYSGKNPDTDLTELSKHWGWDVSIVFSGHITRRSRINLVEIRTGINKDDNDFKE
jgi:hypothetical protein